MLSCKKATELIEKRSIISLSLIEKIQLNLHKSICDACTTYEKQSQKLDDILKAQIASEKAAEENPLKNEELKERMLKKIQK